MRSSTEVRVHRMLPTRICLTLALSHTHPEMLTVPAECDDGDVVALSDIIGDASKVRSLVSDVPFLAGGVCREV